MEYYIKERNWKQILKFIKGIKGMDSKDEKRLRACTRSQERNKLRDSVYKLGYMRSLYPSDISREKFEILNRFLDQF